MSLVSKPTELTDHIRDKKQSEQRGNDLVTDLVTHMDEMNSMSYFDIVEVEELLLREQEHAVKVMKTPKTYPRDIPRFSPSSSSKSELELFFKAIKAKKDEDTQSPFHRRWTRNSTAVHGAVQRQLLEAEHTLENPKFNVVRLDNGLPAWERNIEGWKVIEHNGVKFVLFGMCDGLLTYNKDGSTVGFEYKTKSNSVAQIKQLKQPQDSHVLQTVAYSLLFDVDEWLITYESVAKDKWMTGENARPDVKVFYNKVTEKDKKALLDKWASVATHVKDGEIPEHDGSNLLFFEYKNLAKEMNLI